MAKGLEGYARLRSCARWNVLFDTLRTGFRGPFGAAQDEVE